jgi:hypothetical protein
MFTPDSEFNGARGLSSLYWSYLSPAGSDSHQRRNAGLKRIRRVPPQTHGRGQKIL